MLAIKLQRIGKKHQPSYRLVVADKKSKMAAPPVEDLGSYSSQTKKAHLNTERVNYWLGVGAQPTVTVHNLLVREQILKSPKIQFKFRVPEKKAVTETVPAEPAEAVTAPELSHGEAKEAPAEAAPQA